ncbi:MAG TPA: hypothetical protein DCL66_06105 [Gammaproteobacteria bacterium]|nr:hypothetical protein [Gammaproteobacteria bacterium]
MWKQSFQLDTQVPDLFRSDDVLKVSIADPYCSFICSAEVLASLAWADLNVGSLKLLSSQVAPETLPDIPSRN